MLSRHTFAAGALVAVALARDPGCGGVDDHGGGPNAPCTRSSDCQHDLLCLDGVCREPDAGAAVSADAGPKPDGG